MKNTKILLVVTFLTFLIMYQSVVADGQKGYEEVPYIYDVNADCSREICVRLKQVDKTQIGGLMDFLIEVKLKVNFNKLEVSFEVSDEITYNGETKWVDTAKGDITRYYPIQIDVPKKDTSGIRIFVAGYHSNDGYPVMKSGRTGIYLVTTEDTLGLYHYFPKTEKDEPVLAAATIA